MPIRAVSFFLAVSLLWAAPPALAASVLLGQGTLTRRTPNSLPPGTDEVLIRLTISGDGVDEITLLREVVGLADIGLVQTVNRATPGFDEVQLLLRNDQQDSLVLWSLTPGVGWGGSGNPEYVIFGGGPGPGERDFHGSRIDEIRIQLTDMFFSNQRATIEVRLSVFGEVLPVPEPGVPALLLTAAGFLTRWRNRMR